MNSTQKKGEAGRTFVDTSIFCEERRLMKEHYIYIECDRNWNAHLLAMRLTESHRTYCMTLSGKELGDTYDRPRLAVLALAHQFYIATELSSFLERFGSVPVMRAFKFWASSEQEHAAELQEMMTKRVTPVDTAVEWSDVFLPSHRDNLKNYDGTRFRIASAHHHKAARSWFVNFLLWWSYCRDLIGPSLARPYLPFDCELVADNRP